jgi:hypothetical protein
MARMVETYGSDKNAKDIARVLRVPGYLNRKRGTPHLVRIVDANGRHYTRAEICEAFPPVQMATVLPFTRTTARTDSDRIRDALAHVNADNRDTWLKVGMAIEAELGPAGRPIWDEWSAKSTKYNERGQEATWRSFKGSGVTIGTLFHEAKQNGWRDDNYNGFFVPTSQATPFDELKQRNWRLKLIVSATTGNPKPILANALIALRDAPEWQGVLSYDEFSLVIKLMLTPPWLAHLDNTTWTPTAWTDRDDVLTANWLQHEGIYLNEKVAATAVATVAKEASFHPVRDYLSGLQWDGRRRVEKLASAYLGAKDTPYHAAVSRSMFIAAVARIMRPGVKADYVPILEGAQDKGKSTAIKLLFQPWFSDDLAELGSKDAAMQTRGAWCLEIAELSSMTRADIDRVKAFVTCTTDRFRPPYGRHVIEQPRQCVFVGSTNAETYLKDETGNRRFWPIRCDGQIALDAIARDKDQFWAEAVALYKAGTPWWFDDAEIIAAAREEQAERYQQDPWQEMIAVYVQRYENVTANQVLANLGLEPSRWTRTDQMRVGGCMKALGWERRQVRKGKDREYRYFAPGSFRHHQDHEGGGGW